MTCVGWEKQHKLEHKLLSLNVALSTWIRPRTRAINPETQSSVPPWVCIIKKACALYHSTMDNCSWNEYWTINENTCRNKHNGFYEDVQPLTEHILMIVLLVFGVLYLCPLVSRFLWLQNIYTHTLHQRLLLCYILCNWVSQFYFLQYWHQSCHYVEILNMNGHQLWEHTAAKTECGDWMQLLSHGKQASKTARWLAPSYTCQN